MSEREILIRGGTVVTVDKKDRVLVGDLLVRGDRIVQIGAKIRASKNAVVIDAAECAVIPGFVQAHVHLCQALFRGIADDLPLLQWLKERIWPLEAAHDDESLYASAMLGLGEMLKAGTTCILDMGTVHGHDVVFTAMSDAGMSGFSGKAMMDEGAGVPKGLRETTRQSLRESIALAERWHGKNEGRLGYAFAPRFILSCSEALLRETANTARAMGTLVHSHAAEHRDERAAVKKALGLDDIAALRRYGIFGRNTVLAHGVQLRADEMRRMAEDETRVTHCPSANLKLASGIADVVAMQKAGIVVALGADGAPCNNRMDPWTEMRLAALLAKAKTGRAEALPAARALRLATFDGAHALGIHEETGSLEVGKRADLAVVRLDGLHTEPQANVVSRLVYACVASDVKDVLAAGRLVVSDSTLRTMQEDRIRAAARRHQLRVLRRAKL
ncbi:MAG: 5'-deoxyadenosine deaminase [Sandaracinaceae bacterium]|jgi:5-methylthioadenosine/S-adenosylhomocysteine deaminase|nr:5'-deoxyadenosine deaminase [Sandaracinaceae bacterium]